MLYENIGGRIFFANLLCDPIDSYRNAIDLFEIFIGTKHDSSFSMVAPEDFTIPEPFDPSEPIIEFKMMQVRDRKLLKVFYIVTKGDIYVTSL